MIKTYIRDFLAKCFLVMSGIFFMNYSANAQQNIEKVQADTTKTGSTSAISSVSGQTLYHTPAANVTNTLYGRLSGLIVTQGTGAPGYDAASLNIRGIATYNNPDLAVFVDGFQSNFSYFQYLSATEIESISVLKDAAALAQFGMKGANGVLWVTTKRGHISKPLVQMQLRSGFQQAININKPLGSYEYASLYNQAVSNDNGRIWNPAYTDMQLQEYKDGTGINTNWYDETLKKTTPYLDADFTLSGGDQAVRYLVVGNFLNNQGLYNVSNDDTHSNLQFQSYNLRTNVDMNLFKIIEAKVDLGGRIQNRTRPDYNTDLLYSNLERYPSNIYPVKNVDGTWTGTTLFPDNPVGVTTDYGIYAERDRYLQANLSLKEKLDLITDGLYLSQGISFNTWTRGSNSKYKRYARYIDGVQQTTDKNTNYNVWDDAGTNQYLIKQYTFGLGYDKTVGLHNISAVTNYLAYSYDVDANQNGLANTSMTYNYQNIGGRIHYAYNNKYIAEFGFAAGGSDNYAKGNRWGFYPALSAAWIISNESFLKENDVVSYLKLRLSGGKSGNDQFWGERYLYQQYFGYGGSYNTGNASINSHTGTIQTNVANPGFFAEESMKYNLGVDVILLKKLNFTVDAFMDKRSGIVTQDNSLMATFGGALPYSNIGEVTNKGIEASATFTDKMGTFSYFISGIASYNNNTIDYMAEVQPIAGARQTGYSIGLKYGNQADGFYQEEDFNADGTLKANEPKPYFGNVQPGDIKYKDISGPEGIPDGKIDELDVTRIGLSYLPKTNFSFNAGVEYYGFDFQMLVQGAAGRDVNLLDAYNQTVAFNNNGNAYAIAQGAWAYYPDQNIDTRVNATYPRLSTQGNTNNYRTSSFWVKSGNFLRIRNLEIGYTFTEKLSKKLHISKARIFANATNLYTWSSLLKDYNMDPETMSGVPAMESNTIGFTLNF